MSPSAKWVRTLATAGLLALSPAVLLQQQPKEESGNRSLSMDTDRLFTEMCGEAGGHPPGRGKARAKAQARQEAIPDGRLAGPCDKRLAYRMLAGVALPSPFYRCALVGSSHDLEGAGLGREIDAHDTVVRVNRLPIAAYFNDFGSRTDVLFTAPVQDSMEQYGPRGQNYVEMDGARRICGWESYCPFTSVMLKGADTYECGRVFTERFPPSSPGWRPPASAKTGVAHQVESVNAMAYELLDYDAHWKRPTNGFQAFLTLVHVCSHLDVYGFSGTETADGHEMRIHLHDVEAEHRVIDQIIKGEELATLREFYPAYQKCFLNKTGKIRKMR
mmetsp:Transcript_65423/g.202687  ORF Transcript_65423/g.202687 Transcript_65423/m.202687 type:complete len:331 (+) Transcript_65423:94-1086(+)